jgi:protein-disulfide isomerase
MESRRCPCYPCLPITAPADCCSHSELDQKKFWPYHDLLYANQERLSEPETFKRLAAEVGLDTEEFGRCLDNRETAQEVAWDVVEAQRVSLSRRPSLFINLLYVDGALPFDELSKLMESAALQ